MTDSDEADRGLLAGEPGDRRIGAWSARIIVVLGVGYGIVLILGFVSAGTVRAPLPDPYLGLAEVLIILMAPAMVVLMAATHVCAPARGRLPSLVALGFMLLAAGLTIVVHVVQLTVARRLDPTSVPGFSRLFGWEWPSLLYAVDIVAWDLLLGLSLLFAAPVLAGGPFRAARRGLVASGLLCLVGLVGPAVDVLAWRAIGIAGYAVLFPLTCVALARAFALPVPVVLGPRAPGPRRQGRPTLPGESRRGTLITDR